MEQLDNMAELKENILIAGEGMNGMAVAKSLEIMGNRRRRRGAEQSWSFDFRKSHGLNQVRRSTGSREHSAQHP